MNQVSQKQISDSDITSVPVSSSPTLFNNAPLPKDRQALLDALGYLEKLEDNWDGYEAVSPSYQAINMAGQFTKFLPLNKLHAGKIEPDGDAGIILTWEYDSERILLTIDGIALHLSHEQQGQDTKFIKDFPYYSCEERSLPQDILSHIPNR